MMRSILKIQGGTANSTIVSGGRLQDISQYIPHRSRVVITDTHVRRLYEKDFPDCEVIEIGTGEGIKTLHTVKDIYTRLLELDADRSSFILGIGGGVVCDITGFVASTYLRGLTFGFVASTLLSQVDAGIGGKNGVNVNGYKNMVGVFRQPEVVICDMGMLKTLPVREVLSGFSEIVKHAAIADPVLFSYLEDNHESAVGLYRPVMEKLVYDSIVVKASVVNQDETEKGERRKLNFGHTLGHAIERETGISHGEAVSTGMLMAALLSETKGYLKREAVKRIERLLINLGLPTKMALERNGLIEAVSKDKKRSGEKIHFVFLTEIGDAFVEPMSLNELALLLKQMDWPWI